MWFLMPGAFNLCPQTGAKICSVCSDTSHSPFPPRKPKENSMIPIALFLFSFSSPLLIPLETNISRPPHHAHSRLRTSDLLPPRQQNNTCPHSPCFHIPHPSSPSPPKEGERNKTKARMIKWSKMTREEEKVREKNKEKRSHAQLQPPPP